MNEQIEKIEELLMPMLAGTDMFLIQIKVKPTNNIKVFIDADAGLSISKSAGINRTLYHAIEEAGLYPEGDFSLEVSSPGIDEPLKQVRQYLKNLGRDLEITPLDESEPPQMGKLTRADEESCTIAVTDKKKKQVSEHHYSYDKIKSAVVQISFK